MSPRTILRLPAVTRESGYSRTTLYSRVNEKLWTKPVKLGARAIGWPADEVAALNTARIAGMKDSDIQALVSRLEAARTIGGAQ